MKSILLDDFTHAQLKIYCEQRGLKIGKYIQTLILNTIKNENGNLYDLRTGNERPDKRKSFEKSASN